MRWFKYVLIIFCIPLLKAQRSVVLMPEFRENTQYNINILSKSHFTIDFDGNEEAMNAIKKEGITMPLKVYGEAENNSLLSTSKKQPDQKIPFVIKYKKGTIKRSINDIETNYNNPILGAKIYGYYKGIIPKIDSIESKTLDASTKKLYMDTVEATLKNLKYSTKELKVGDTLKQIIPMQIPIPVVGNININMETIYKLTGFDGDLAFFDTDTSFDFNMTNPNHSNKEKFQMTMTGQGDGKLVFDDKNKCITSFEATIGMKGIFKQKDFNLLFDGSTQSTTNINLISN